MKLAISNLAWDANEDKRVLDILLKHGVDLVEIAPSKVWPDPSSVSKAKIKQYREFWQKNGVNIIATTHILSPFPDLTLFETKAKRKKALEYLKRFVEVSSILGAQVMNFGSPKNRRRNGLAKKEAEAIAVDFFGNVVGLCEQHDIKLAFEPNPKIYGGDFINKTSEAIALARKVDHPYFGINLDVSTMTENNEPYHETIKGALPFAFHFHISEPGLVPIPGTTDHKSVAKALSESQYDRHISIEMSLKNVADRKRKIESALEFVDRTYN